MQPLPQAPARVPCSPTTTPTALLAIVVVIVVVILVEIAVIADPLCSAIKIVNAIAITAPGQRIIGSTMALALLFLGGWEINTKVEE
jgi:hypothetical protein